MLSISSLIVKWLQLQSDCEKKNRQQCQLQVHHNCYVPVCPCSFNAAEMKGQEKMTEGQEKSQDERLDLPILKSRIERAKKKMRYEECAEEWLSQQGQYYYVCILLASTTPDT